MTWLQCLRPVPAERLSAVMGGRPRHLVLDLAGAGFMDCGQSLPPDGRLVIRRPSRPVR